MVSEVILRSYFEIIYNIERRGIKWSYVCLISNMMYPLDAVEKTIGKCSKI